MSDTRKLSLVLSAAAIVTGTLGLLVNLFFWRFQQRMFDTFAASSGWQFFRQQLPAAIADWYERAGRSGWIRIWGVIYSAVLIAAGIVWLRFA